MSGDQGPAVQPATPLSREARRGRPSRLLDLPSELLERACLRGAPWGTLCSLGATCKALHAPARHDDLWRIEWERVYGDMSAIQEGAARLAGGWKALFGARHAALREADPWLKPAQFEVQAAIDLLAAAPPTSARLKLRPPPTTAGTVEAAPAAAGGEAHGSAAGSAGGDAAGAGAAQAPDLCLVYMIDGSGSVTEEDFQVMTEFMLTATQRLAASCAAAGTSVHVAVLQFSSEVRVEHEPAAVDVAAFEAMLGGLRRMNGGTNIAAAVQRAGQLLKPLGPGTRRVLALLTDGRIDSHQSREARDMAARLGDEQAGVSVHAFGVGRGVDRAELLRICAAREPATAESRYLGLMTLDEAPW